MLLAPNLPPLARRRLLEYIQGKLSGVYGHNPKQLRRFSRLLKQHLEKLPVPRLDQETMALSVL
jgi:hypothetical protein